jgi:hypothetical protein
MQNFEPGQFGKWLILAGFALAAAGAVMLISSKIGLFRLPGDMESGGRNWRIYFPLMTSIILSVILTLAIWIYKIFRG